MSARWLLAAALLCCGALAAQDEVRELTPLGLLELERDAAGARARVRALRYRGTRKPMLRTYGQGLDGRLYVKIPALADQLEQDRDGAGNALTPYRSVIDVEGVLRWGGDELGILLEVEQVTRQPDDLTRLREALEALPPEDRAGRVALRARARQRLVTAHAAEDRAALRGFADELRAELEAQNLARLGALPAKAAAWLAAGEAEGDLAVLAQAWRHPEVAPALKDELARAMNALQARRLGDTWYPLGEFRHVLGFRRHPDRRGALTWMSTRRAEFHEAAQELLALLALSDSSPFGASIAEVLEKAVARGEVLRGMGKDHIVRMQREGRPYLPATVSRMIDPAVGEQPEVVWEQWAMPDGLRVYFYNGVVCSTVQPESD